MVGKDHRAVGGGSNFLCLPDHPQYDLRYASNNPNAVIGIFLRGTMYRGFSSSVIDGRVPCAA